MVVGRVLGSIQLGFYGMAFQFAALPIDKLVTIVSQVAFPSFASLQEDHPTLTRYFLKLTSMVALVTFPILIGMALVADLAIELFLTTKWLPVVVPLQILCVVSCFRAVEMLCHPLAVAKGQPRISLLNSLLQAIVLPGCFVVGAMYGGLKGVAMAWLFTRPFIFLFVTTLTLRTIRLPFSKYLQVLWHPVAGCLLLTIVVVGVRQMVVHTPLAVQVALVCGSGFLAYAVYQLVLNQEMLREALEVIRSRRVPRNPTVGGSSEAPAAL
jgi:O-antigen/teichoic acid export membrane protein